MLLEYVVVWELVSCVISVSKFCCGEVDPGGGVALDPFSSTFEHGLWGLKG